MNEKLITMVMNGKIVNEDLKDQSKKNDPKKQTTSKEKQEMSIENQALEIENSSENNNIEEKKLKLTTILKILKEVKSIKTNLVILSIKFIPRISMK